MNTEQPNEPDPNKIHMLNRCSDMIEKSEHNRKIMIEGARAARFLRNIQTKDKATGKWRAWLQGPERAPYAKWSIKDKEDCLKELEGAPKGQHLSIMTKWGVNSSRIKKFRKELQELGC